MRLAQFDRRQPVADSDPSQFAVARAVACGLPVSSPDTNPLSDRESDTDVHVSRARRHRIKGHDRRCSCR